MSRASRCRRCRGLSDLAPAASPLVAFALPASMEETCHLEDPPPATSAGMQRQTTRTSDPDRLRYYLDDEPAVGCPKFAAPPAALRIVPQSGVFSCRTRQVAGPAHARHRSS